MLNCMLNVQCTDNAVLCSTYRQLNHAHFDGFLRQGAFCLQLSSTVITQLAAVRVTVEATAVHSRHRRQQLGESAHSSGFGRALFTFNQNTAQGRVNNIQNQGQLHFLLSYNRSKRIYSSTFHLYSSIY